MRGYITTPKDHVWFDFTIDNIAHLSDYVNRDITAVSSKRASLEGFIGGESICSTAADHILALL